MCVYCKIWSRRVARSRLGSSRCCTLAIMYTTRTRNAFGRRLSVAALPPVPQPARCLTTASYCWNLRITWLHISLGLPAVYRSGERTDTTPTHEVVSHADTMHRAFIVASCHVVFRSLRPGFCSAAHCLILLPRIVRPPLIRFEPLSENLLFV